LTRCVAETVSNSTAEDRAAVEAAWQAVKERVLEGGDSEMEQYVAAIKTDLATLSTRKRVRSGSNNGEQRHESEDGNGGNDDGLDAHHDGMS
jgi:hypothetical protein